MKIFIIIYFIFHLIYPNILFSKWTVYNRNNTGIVDIYQISSITSDRSNNMWFVNDMVSIIMFDGFKWYEFFPSDIDGDIPSFRSATSIAVDSNNNIWVSDISDQIAKYNGSNWSIYQFEDNIYLKFTNIEVDKDNNIWIGFGKWWGGDNGKFQGIMKFDGQNFQTYSFVNFTLPSTTYDITDISVDKNNTVWAIISSSFYSGEKFCSELIKFDGLSWTVYYRYNSELNIRGECYLNADTTGNIWIVCPENFLKFDGENFYDMSEQFIHPKWFFPQALTVDYNNNLWVACIDGLYKFDHKKWTHFKTSDIGISDNDLFSIHVDKKGNIWIGGNSEIAVYEEDPIHVEESETNDKGIKIIPNPVEDLVKLSFHTIIENDVKISLSNYMGNTVKEFNLNSDELHKTNEAELDVSELPSGLYFATIRAGGQVQTEKFLILR
ncbi:MAG: two-component regulator propeller domain-containing protein [bacterium]